MTMSSHVAARDEIPEFPREIADGVLWLNHCIPSKMDGKIIHVHLSIYMVLGAEKTLLVDTSLPTYWSDIGQQVEKALNGRTLDYLFVTHPEVPHSGAMPLLLDRYPKLKVIGDVRDFHVYFPEYEDRFVPARPGDSIDLGGRHFRIVDAVIKDLPNSLWGYDDLTQSLFVSDGFSFTHRSGSAGDAADPISSSLRTANLDEDDEPTHIPGECARMSSELGVEVDVKQASFVLRRALAFSRFVDPEPLFEEVNKVLDDYPPKLICPAHGSVIDNVDDIVPVIRKTHEAVFKAG